MIGGGFFKICKVLQPLHWNHLHCNLNKHFILYLALTQQHSAALARQFMRLPIKGMHCKIGHFWQLKDSSIHNSPEIKRKMNTRGAEAPGAAECWGLGALRHQQQSFPCTLLCFCVQSRRSAVVCSRPFNEEHLLAASGCASSAARSSSCCKGNRPAAAAFWFKRVNAL